MIYEEKILTLINQDEEASEESTEVDTDETDDIVDDTEDIDIEEEES